MFAKDSSVLEVDSRMSPRDAYRRRNFLDHGSLLHKPQNGRAIVAIRVGKRQDLSCVEKAVCFSHKHNFVINLNLYIYLVKIRHLDNDQLVCDISNGLIEDGVLWLYSRSRRPSSLPALLSHCRVCCALTKASRPPLDSLPLLG